MNDFRAAVQQCLFLSLPLFQGNCLTSAGSFFFSNAGRRAPCKLGGRRYQEWIWWTSKWGLKLDQTLLQTICFDLPISPVIPSAGKASSTPCSPKADEAGGFHYHPTPPPPPHTHPSSSSSSPHCPSFLYTHTHSPSTPTLDPLLKVCGLI